MNAENADPHAIRTQVDALLADLPLSDLQADLESSDIDAVGHRLEQAHQILVDALESVERG